MKQQEDFYREFFPNECHDKWHPKDRGFNLRCEGWEEFCKWFCETKPWGPIPTSHPISWDEYLKEISPNVERMLQTAAKKAAYGIAPGNESEIKRILDSLHFWNQYKPKVYSRVVTIPLPYVWKGMTKIVIKMETKVNWRDVSRLSDQDVKLLRIPADERIRNALNLERILFLNKDPYWDPKYKYNLFGTYEAVSPPTVEIPDMKFLYKDGQFVGVPIQKLEAAPGNTALIRRSLTKEKEKK